MSCRGDFGAAAEKLHVGRPVSYDNVLHGQRNSLAYSLRRCVTCFIRYMRRCRWRLPSGASIAEPTRAVLAAFAKSVQVLFCARDIYFRRHLSLCHQPPYLADLWPSCLTCLVPLPL